MVLNFEEEKQLIELKHKNVMEQSRATNENSRNIHLWKMKELTRELEIVKEQTKACGGV